MYIPSYDFRIFDVPLFSPLQAQEFGASTMFSANTPLGYIDNSLTQFADLMNPTFFQGGQETSSELRERARRARDAAEKVYRDAQSVYQGTGGEDCKEGRNILGGCGPILGSKPMRSDGKGTVGDDPTKSGQKIGGVIEATQNLFKALPTGSGVFLIAIVVIILLLLFVKR